MCTCSPWTTPFSLSRARLKSRFLLLEELPHLVGRLMSRRRAWATRGFISCARSLRLPVRQSADERRVGTGETESSKSALPREAGVILVRNAVRIPAAHY